MSTEGAEEDEAAAAAARPGGMGTVNPSARRFAAASHPRRPALSSFWHFNEHVHGGCSCFHIETTAALFAVGGGARAYAVRLAAVKAPTRARPAAVEPACASSNKIAELGSDLER